ncbi:MAG: 50S ribosomal protein L17 [Vampirovibrionales bacterium]|nr:50S ribosomal protein L17 [Vampirovibrionales bacterium]
MRHRKRVHKLGRPADQRRAMMRSLATSLLTHDQIVITMPRAKALREVADKLVTLAKRGDLHAIRQAARLIFPQKTGRMIPSGNGKEMPETVLRRLFKTVGPRFANRQGGYTRIIPAPPRRGDAAPMAVIEFTD